MAAAAAGLMATTTKSAVTSGDSREKYVTLGAQFGDIVVLSHFERRTYGTPKLRFSWHLAHASSTAMSSALFAAKGCCRTVLAACDSIRIEDFEFTCDSADRAVVAQSVRKLVEIRFRDPSISNLTSLSYRYRFRARPVDLPSSVTGMEP